jgi:murein biosynthesis integral membrane protein MurJ
MNLLSSRTKNTNLNRQAFMQLATMIFLTMITQAVTLIKTSVTAANFGATAQMDAFNFSNSIGTFIFSFIGTGITTVLIPAIINKKENKSINNFITILYGASLIFVFIIFLGRRYIVSAMSSGSSDFIEIACNIMLITLITQFLNTILGVTNAVFQCNGKFNIPKVVTLLTTALLTLLVIMHSNLSIYEFAFYIFITMVLNVVIQYYIVHKDGFKYKPIIDFKDEQLRDMLKIFIPTMFSSGLYQVSLLTDSLISSNLGEGKISILSYSNTIMTMINMLLIGNLMTYIYPKITKNIDKENGQKVLFDYCIFFNAFMFLIVVGFLIVGKDGIILLYQRGKFDESITNMVYNCSLLFIIGLPINVMRDAIYRYFYAKGNTKTTFINSLYASIINIVISIILSFFIGLYGVILGTVITSVYSLTSILIRFKKQYQINCDKRYIIVENFKIVLVSSVVVIISLMLKDIFRINNNILSILIYGSLIVVLYIIGLFMVKSKVYKIKL